MKASQYKAVRDTGVTEFAVFPSDVADKLPWAIENANKEQSVRACPTGLVQATVLADNVTWTEAFTLGCGDTEYQREHHNGVSVSIALNDLRGKKESVRAAVKRIKSIPRAKISGPTGEQRVELVVSKAAIMAPWNEYALIEAEREKAKAEAQEREQRLQRAVEAIGARAGHYTEVHSKFDRERDEYVAPKDYDYTAPSPYGRQDPVYLRGEVLLSLARAEEIAALLAAAH